MNDRIGDEETLLTEGGVLGIDGKAAQAGYALSPVLKYDRGSIKTSKLRIKEWDYYMVTGGGYSVAFTLSDHYYMGLNTIGLIRQGGGKPFARTLREIELFPMGKYDFPPPDEKRELKFEGKKLSLRYNPSKDGMIISGHSDNFFGERFEAQIELYDFPQDNMVILTPFKDRRYFYYNLKTNCISAKGYFLLGGRRVDFPAGQSFAVYDCGRGAWPLKNRWYWATSSAVDGESGKKFGFNLGYGFGDTSAASENMLFFDGRAHKLKKIKIEIPLGGRGRECFSADGWRFYDYEGRLDLTFTPSVVRRDNVRAAFIYSKQNQTFGLFKGRAVLDDGRVIEVNQCGSCEVFDNNG